MAGDTCPFPASRARVSAYLFAVVVKLTLERASTSSGAVGAVIEIQSRPADEPGRDRAVLGGGGGGLPGAHRRRSIDPPIAVSRDRCRWRAILISEELSGGDLLAGRRRHTVVLVVGSRRPTLGVTSGS